MTNSATAATKAPEKPNGLIQQLEALLGRPLSNEAKAACEQVLMNVTINAVQAASYTTESARQLAVDAHGLAAVHVSSIMAGATP
jgi:hypothetical protein